MIYYTTDTLLTSSLQSFCLRSFKMADNILRGWTKDKVQKSLAEALNRFEKQEKR